MAEQETWIVDRIESAWAVLERDGQSPLNVPLDLLPAGIEEGDVLAVTRSRGTDQASLVMRRDEAAKRQRGERVGELASKLRRRDPGGDVKL